MSVKLESDKRAPTARRGQRPSGWPVRFYVCAFHKENYYSDFKDAILDESKCCTLCEPCDNDSLGG